MQKPIFTITSLPKLDLMYTWFQQTRLAAEGLTVLTHSPFNPTLNEAFQNVLAPALSGDNGRVHSFLLRYFLFPVKITIARLYIFSEASVPQASLLETIPYLLVE